MMLEENIVRIVRRVPFVTLLPSNGAKTITHNITMVILVIMVIYRPIFEWIFLENREIRSPRISPLLRAVKSPRPRLYQKIRTTLYKNGLELETVGTYDEHYRNSGIVLGYRVAARIRTSNLNKTIYVALGTFRQRFPRQSPPLGFFDSVFIHDLTIDATNSSYVGFVSRRISHTVTDMYTR